MIIYQFSNFVQIAFIVFFSVVSLLGIGLGIFSSPLIKMTFAGGNSARAKLLLLPIVILLYALSLSLIIFPLMSISDYYTSILDTNIETCSVATGEIEELELSPQYARGATLTSYHLKFRIGEAEYHIETDAGVPADNIGLWNEGDCITVYYRVVNGKNQVIRAVSQ